MAAPMTQEEIYKIARKRVEEKKGLLVHAIVYVFINIILFLIWFFTSREYPWFIWPLGGWGIGLIFHALGVFVFDREMGWEKKAVEREAEKIWERNQVEKEIEKARQNNKE